MKPRTESVDENVTAHYHIITRCVRSLILLNRDGNRLKIWLENRMRFLSEQFSIDVNGYCIMDNHIHIIIRLDTPRSLTWSDIEVVRRWATVYIPREPNGKPIPKDQREAWIQACAALPAFVAKARTTMSNLGCFMKCLKQPLSRMANREDGKKGAFFESRYKSIGIEGELRLTSANIYTDLNPVAAKIVTNPDNAQFTGLNARLKNAANQGVTKEQLDAASADFTDFDTAEAARQAAAGINAAEKSHWMPPIHDDRRNNPNDRPGMSDRQNLASYRKLVHAVAAKRQRMADALLTQADLDNIAKAGLTVQDVIKEVRRLQSIAATDRWGCQDGAVEQHRNPGKEKQTRRFTHTTNPPSSPPPPDADANA